MRELRVVTITFVLLMLSTSTVASSMPIQWPMISFPSDIMGNDPLYDFYSRTVDGNTGLSPMANIFPQPYTIPGEYGEMACPPSMTSLFSSKLASSNTPAISVPSKLISSPFTVLNKGEWEGDNDNSAMSGTGVAYLLPGLTPVSLSTFEQMPGPKSAVIGDTSFKPYNVMQAIINSGYLQKHNTGLINSSVQLISSTPHTDSNGIRSESSTYQFMTTDGKAHTCHVSQNTYPPTNPVVVDVDGESFVM